jgi:hypothetical protein
MASEADTRHRSLGILLAQARAEKITCIKFQGSRTSRLTNAFVNLFRRSTPGASPPSTEVSGGEAAVGSRPTPAYEQADVACFRSLSG